MNRPLSSNLLFRVATALVVLPLVVVLIRLLPQRGPWLLAATLCVVGASEAHTLLSRASLKASTISFLPGIALFFEMAGFPGGARPFPVSGLPIVAGVVAALVAVMRAERLGIPALAAEGAGVLCGLAIGLGTGSFAALASLSPLEQGTSRIAFLMAAVISSDVFAYFAGRALGRHKLAPQVSPGKTVEGALGGLVAAAIASAVTGTLLFKGQPVGFMVAAGVLVAATGIVGDLLESLFKRSVGAKDSGTLFPGHGGALDRMDAFILAAPLTYAFFRAIS